jgi:hypothetical protein
MNKEKIKKLIVDEGLTITDVIDAVIELNGIIGVGLITLGDGLKDYVWHHKALDGYINDTYAGDCPNEGM